MDLAARRLRDTDDSLEAIARSVGYTSVHAFSRAFSRLRAPRPGSTAPPPAKSRGDANPRSGPGRRIQKPAFGKRAALFRSRPGAEVHLREANAKAARSALDMSSSADPCWHAVALLERNFNGSASESI
jgi:hypothetical protein